MENSNYAIVTESILINDWDGEKGICKVIKGHNEDLEGNGYVH